MGIHKLFGVNSFEGQLLLEVFECTGQKWECSEVHRHYVPCGLEEAGAGKCCSFWTHGESVTYRQQDDMRLVHLLNQLHTHEDVGVTSMVDPRTLEMRKLNDEAAG